MKIYKYWTIEKQRILMDGAEQEVTCYDRWNVSVEDARGRREKRLRRYSARSQGKSISLKIMRLRSVKSYCKRLTIIPPSRGTAMAQGF